MLIRSHPDTGKIVRVTILGFKERFERSSAALLPVVFDQIRPA